MSTEFMVNAQNVTKKYDDFKALDDLSLEVNRGGAWALLGPNGAGKTTFLKCLLGLKEFDGLIQIDGIDIQRDPKKAKSLIGYVPQHPALYDELSVQEELRYFGDMRDVKRARVRELIEFVGLEAWARQPVGALSGGMKRRLLIAKALSHEPRILFLDEPTAGVDVELRKEMWELVRRLRDNGVTIILTTHYIEEAEEIADRVAVINHGEIIIVDNKVDLMRKLGRKQLVLDLYDELDFIPEALASYKMELKEGGKQLVYTYDIHAEHKGITALMTDLGSAGIRYKDMVTEQSSLEDIFVEEERVPPKI